jgi:hypothetical protein
VRPEDGISDIFRPYIACHEGVCINVVPRDREVSNAQESGLNPRWFRDEVLWRTAGSPRPDERRLVTTWSDGENGGWFRQTHEPSGFFGHFFAPYMEQVRDGTCPIIPVRLADYLGRVTRTAHAQVQTGAWNVGSTSGEDLSRWSGSERQREAVAEVAQLSARYWQIKRGSADATARCCEHLARARRLILEAETSCFLFWGDSWIPHLHARTHDASLALDEAQIALTQASRADANVLGSGGLAQ